MIYLRKEKTTDEITLKQPASLSKTQRDVVAYRDEGCTKAIGRWPWHYESKPTKRNRKVTLNCITEPVTWLPDLD